jgi:hypothetical protein
MNLFVSITLSCATMLLVLGLMTKSSAENLVVHPGDSANVRVKRQGPRELAPREGKTASVTKEKAIAIASADVAKIYESIRGYKPVACEKTSLWVIVFDGGDFEYYIDKKTGSIVSLWKLPTTSNPGGGTGRRKTINESRAIKIASEHFGDFLESYGDPKAIVNDYDARPCELANAWRVFFEYRPVPGQPIATLPNTNPPNYVIDKHTGKIIFTTHQLAVTSARQSPR